MESICSSMVSELSRVTPRYRTKVFGKTILPATNTHKTSAPGRNLTQFTLARILFQPVKR